MRIYCDFKRFKLLDKIELTSALAHTHKVHAQKPPLLDMQTLSWALFLAFLHIQKDKYTQNYINISHKYNWLGLKWM